MSLPALALLIALTMALRAALGTQARVLMMPADPLAEALEHSVPTVAIFLETEALSAKARRLLGDTRTVNLTVQAILPAGTVRLGQDESAAELDPRQAGAAFVFAWLYRALEAALVGRAGGAWGDQLRAFALGFEGEIETATFRLEVQRGDPPATIRTAAIEFVLPCTVIESPEFGAEPYAPWSDLIAAVEAEPALVAVAPFLASLVAGEPMPDWRIEQALLGLSDPERSAVGLGPIFDADDVYAATELTLVTNGVSRTVEAEP